MKNIRVVILILLWALGACQVAPDAAEEPLATAVPLPTPLPATETFPPPLCTPPACAANELYYCDGDCPGGCGTICATVTPSVDVSRAPATWGELESWLTAVWQANVDANAGQRALQHAGWQKSEADWQTADLTGDGQEEWIVILYAPGEALESAFGAPGNLWIVNNDGVIYRYYESVEPESWDNMAPALIGLVDMTGSGAPELAIDEPYCGAHTCFGNYQILSSVQGRIQNIVQRPPEYEGAPADVITISYATPYFEDYTGDGRPDFLVHGGSIGSVGAGIVRTYTEVWAWDGTAVTLADVVLDPTEYRHHVLYEANDLMAAGELDRALALYEQAINDPALSNELFWVSEEEAYAAISQFAAFRLILIDLRQGNDERAASRLAWLNATYPGTAAAQAAVTLVNNWRGAGDLPALCQQIEFDLQAVENPTGPLADLGYGNPSLGAGDFCP